MQSGAALKKKKSSSYTAVATICHKERTCWMRRVSEVLIRKVLMEEKFKTSHCFLSYVKHLDFPVLFSSGWNPKIWTWATAAFDVVEAPTTQRGVPKTPHWLSAGRQKRERRVPPETKTQSPCQSHNRADFLNGAWPATQLHSSDFWAPYLVFCIISNKSKFGAGGGELVWVDEML